MCCPCSECGVRLFQPLEKGVCPVSGLEVELWDWCLMNKRVPEWAFLFKMPLGSENRSR